MKTFSKFAGLALSLCLSTSVFAAKSDEMPQEGCTGLKVATGQPGKGYSKLFADMKKACGSQVSLCEVNTTGGLDNLNSLSTKEADIGFAQVDTLQTMKNGDENIAGLQAVAGLNYNYLHIVTSSKGFSTKTSGGLFGFKSNSPTVTIQKFSDLKGQRVALVGSAQLLGRQIDKMVGHGMTYVDVDTDAKAFEMVNSGQVAAALSVSGWPSGVIKDLTQASGLTLVPFDRPLTNAGYVVRTVNYKGLGVYNMNMLATPNLLLSRPFKGPKASEVAKVKQCLSSKLGELQEGDYQPAWNEIKNLNETYGVPVFKK